MRIILIGALMIPLSGCLTTGGVREIRTTPPGALVSVENFGACETPCTVKLDRERHIRVAKAGYVTQNLTIGPGRGAVKITLELAAASKDVDAQALPDIE